MKKYFQGKVSARGIAYTLSIVLLAMILALYFYLLSRIFLPQNPGDVKEILIFVFLALVCSFIFQPIRHMFEKATKPMFFRHGYQKDELLQTFAKTMASDIDLNSLLPKLLQLINTQLEIDKAVFVVLHEGEVFLVRSTNDKKHPYITLSEEELALLKNSELQVLKRLPDGMMKHILEREEFSVSVALKTGENLIGFLFLGEKASGIGFTHEDLKLLEILAPQLAVALQNALRFEIIRQFNETLKEEIDKETDKLRKANEHLQELDRMKDQFIATTSHQMRTPLTVIRGFLWLVMQDKSLSEKIQDRLRRALGATIELIALVNDVLDISRIDDGKIEFTPVQFPISQVALEVTEELESLAVQKHIVFAVESEEDCLVTADKNKIRQVFVNLIDNALKFSQDNGKITISCKKKDSWIETAVIDTGVGIKKEDLPQLFTKFGRLDHTYASVSQVPGTGLGLYICKKVIERSGGKIWIDSKLGHGATVTFTLPVS